MFNFILYLQIDGSWDMRHTYFLLQYIFLMAIIQLLWFIAIWYMMQNQPRRNHISNTIREERERVRDDLMRYLVGSERYRDIIRMGPKAFVNLCGILQREEGLRPTQWVTIEEQVAKFLYLIGHNVRNHAITFFLQWSGETISCHFHSVLNSLIQLEQTYLK